MAACALAKASGAAAELTGSSLFFKLWSAATFGVEYWNGMKAEGQTPDSLRRLVGPTVTVVALHGIFEPQNRHERKYHLSPTRFGRLLHLLSKRYQFVTPEEAFSRHCSNPLVLTFDDGYRDFYSEVFPLVSRTALKPLVFVVVDHIGRTNVWDQSYGVRQQQLLDL